MCESHFGSIGYKLLGEFAICQISPVLDQVAAPRAEMDFVNRNGRLAIVALPTLRHPSSVLPQMSRRLDNDRRGLWRPLRALGLRIRLERQQLTIGAEDLIFVEMTGAQTGYEQFPEPADIAHRHPPAVPAVEITDNADPTRIRCPYGKRDALHTPMDERMCSELAVAREMITLGEQVNVDLPENLRKRIEVIEFALGTAARHAQPVPPHTPPRRRTHHPPPPPPTARPPTPPSWRKVPPESSSLTLCATS